MSPRRNRRPPEPLAGPAETLLTVELTREEWWLVLFACIGSPDRNEFDDEMLGRIGDQIRYQLRPSLVNQERKSEIYSLTRSQDSSELSQNEIGRGFRA